METVWKRVKSTIKKRVPAHSFNMWIEPLKVAQSDESGWIVSCPNFFSKNRVEGLYGAMIKKALQHALGQD
jgi:chromosomal replication initiator protein